jgi:hypothetical protein
MKAILKSEELLPYLQNPDTTNSTYPKANPAATPAVTTKSIQKNDDAIVTAIFLATAERHCHSLLSRVTISIVIKTQ